MFLEHFREAVLWRGALWAGARRLGGTICIFLFALSCARDLDAQNFPAGSCVGCEIARARISVVGKPEDSVLLGVTAKPLILTDGRILTMPDDRSGVMVFDRAGNLSARTSRRGEGPGEFSRVIDFTRGPGDSLYVLQRGRFDVLTSRASYVRSVPVPDVTVGGSFKVLANGSLVFFSSSGNTQDFIHVMSRDGKTVRSFGRGRLPAGGCSGITCRARLFTQARSPDEFYAVSPFDYQIELWSALGSLRRTFTISSGWLVSARGGSASGGKPPPRITGISLGDNGVLFVAGEVANEHWVPPASDGFALVGGRVVSVNRGGSVSGSGLTAGLTVVDSAPIFDSRGFTTMVDAIDAATGRVLATASYQGEVLYVLSGGLAFSRSRDSDGVVSLTIWSLSLKRPPGAGR